MDSSLIIVMGAVMIAVGLGFLVLLFKGNESRKPRDMMEWVGTVLSVLLIIAASALISLANREVNPASQGRVATPAVFQDATIEVPAGNFSFTRLEDGQEIDLKSLRGDVLILNFWATWCAPCLREIPDLNRLQESYADSGLVIVSISDESRDVLNSFEEQVELRTLSVITPPGIDLPVPFKGAFNIRPASFVIDRDGTVRRYVLGARTYGFFEEAITPYL